MSNRPLKVLFVDDEKDVCKAFLQIFNTSTVQVRIAHDGAGALKAIADDEPDLIFLDHFLPGLTGLDLAKQIKSHIPLVSVSGQTLFDPGARFFRVVGKPFRRHDITVIFDSIIRRRTAL